MDSVSSPTAWFFSSTFAGRHRSILHTIKPRGPPTRVGSAGWLPAIPSKTFSRRRSSNVNTRASFFDLRALTSLCAFGFTCASGCVLPSACSWLRQCALKCAGTFGHQAVRRHGVVWRVISSVQLVSWRCGLFMLSRGVLLNSFRDGSTQVRWLKSTLRCCCLHTYATRSAHLSQFWSSARSTLTAVGRSRWHVLCCFGCWVFTRAIVVFASEVPRANRHQAESDAQAVTLEERMRRSQRRLVL